MKSIRICRFVLLWGIGCILILTLILQVVIAGEPRAKIIFGVTWYDVGRAALEGLEGIKKVTNGWRDSTEINTVYYDFEIITVKEMEEALKKAGTYKKTIYSD